MIWIDSDGKYKIILFIKFLIYNKLFFTSIYFLANKIYNLFFLTHVERIVRRICFREYNSIDWDIILYNKSCSSNLDTPFIYL
jgi:hypothetical protein